jgi:hypothetical protein
VRGKGWKVPSSLSYPIRLQDDVSGPIGDGTWYHLVLVRWKDWKVPSSQSYPIILKDDVSEPIGDGAWYHLVLARGKGWKAPSFPSAWTARRWYSRYSVVHVFLKNIFLFF